LDNQVGVHHLTKKVKISTHLKQDIKEDYLY